ncbi:MAG: TonB-dependent receptor [Asticcacaulis sp.]
MSCRPQSRLPFSHLAVLATTASLLPFLPLAARADASADASATEVIVVGQKNAPITVVPRGLSVSLGKDQLGAVNAVNVEDFVKYAPNIFIRKRFAGDDNGVIALRGANIVESARTLVLVDGYVVSNLLGNRWDYAPKWNVAAPSEIRQFDIVYGPYSARYSGNSMGGVVSITTETPKKTEAFGNVKYFSQPYKAYGADDSYNGYSLEGGFNYKQKEGPWSARFTFRHFENTAQTMNFYSLVPSSAPGTYLPVTGAYADSRLAGPVFSDNSPTDIVQDQQRLRIGYDFANGWKADAFLMAWSTQQTQDKSVTWIMDADGHPVWATSAGTKVQYDGVNYIAKGGMNAFMERREYMAGGKLSGEWKGWDVRLNLSNYTIPDWDSRASLDPVNPAGTRTVYGDIGWSTFDGVAEKAFGRHSVALGASANQYQNDVFNYTVPNWQSTTGQTLSSRTFGKTALTGVFVEDAIDLNGPVMTLGLRYDDWRAFDGGISNPDVTRTYKERHETAISPKFSLQGEVGDGWQMQLSLGTASRFPTVGELFQGRILSGETELDPLSFDPNLKTEVSTDASLMVRRRFDKIVLTGSLYGQDVDNAIYSYSGTLPNGTTVSRYQNVDRMQQYGLEFIFESHDLLLNGLDIESSVSWIDSQTVKNSAAPEADGKTFPLVPKWRVNGHIRYAFTPRLNGSLGWRYASRPAANLFGNRGLDAFGNTTEYLFVDTRLSYALTPAVEISLGIDNINNDLAYQYHPMPQRSYMLEVNYRR